MPNVPTSLMITHTHHFHAFRLMKWFLFFSKLLDQIRSNKMKLETQIPTLKSYDGLHLLFPGHFPGWFLVGPPKDTSIPLYKWYCLKKCVSIPNRGEDIWHGNEWYHMHCSKYSKIWIHQLYIYSLGIEQIEA